MPQPALPRGDVGEGTQTPQTTFPRPVPVSLAPKAGAAGYLEAPGAIVVCVVIDKDSANKKFSPHKTAMRSEILISRLKASFAEPFLASEPALHSPHPCTGSSVLNSPKGLSNVESNHRVFPLRSTRAFGRLVLQNVGHKDFGWRVSIHKHTHQHCILWQT